MSDPVYTARRNSILKRFQDADERQMREDVRKIMASPEGRRVFMAACYHGGIFRYSTRDDNHAYMAGKRDAALELFKTVKAFCPVEATNAQIERDRLVVERDRELNEATKNEHEQENR